MPDVWRAWKKCKNWSKSDREQLQLLEASLKLPNVPYVHDTQLLFIKLPKKVVFVHTKNGHQYDAYMFRWVSQLCFTNYVYKVSDSTIQLNSTVVKAPNWREGTSTPSYTLFKADVQSVLCTLESLFMTFVLFHVRRHKM